MQEWIPLEWGYFTPGENAARGPFLWDQMLGWKLQGWLAPDLLIMPRGFRRTYRLAELFPGEASNLADANQICSEQASFPYVFSMSEEDAPTSAPDTHRSDPKVFTIFNFVFSYLHEKCF